jgi:gliding motility-associated-like protein
MKFLNKIALFSLLMLLVVNASSQTTLFFDNCNTMGNWTNTGRIYPSNNTGYNWLSVDPIVPSDDHTGGGNCLYVNGNSNYVVANAGNYILYRIQSSAINLAGWDNTRLEFWMQLRSETGNWDGAFLEWSHNGTTWTQLNSELCVPYDGSMSNNASSTPFYPNLKPAWCNPRTTWTRVLVNLSAIDNVPAFYLRYTFHSDEEAMDRGWAIDDIKIVSVATLQLQGNAIVIPVNTAPIAANNTDFGGCSVGQFVDKEFFIHNTGESPLTLTGTPFVITTGAGFSVLTQPATNTIAPGQSVPFTVRFLPGSVGNFTGTISIPNSDIYSTCAVAPAVYNIKASSTNTPPQISGLADVTACPGAGPISVPFMVADIEQNPNVVTLSGTSSNQAIIPNANILFTGSGANREVSFTALPGQTGNVTITITANDGQPVNNTSTATFNVLLQDNVPPIALCQNVTVQLDANGNGSITPQQVNNGSSDNCLLGLLSVSQSQFSCADVGVLNLIFDAADAVGNTAQCPFDVTVLPPSGSLALQSPEFFGGNEVSCNGANDGTINAQAQGGCGPYTYRWTEIPGFDGIQATNLAAGTYHVQATDATGQVWDAQITLVEPQPLVNLSTSANVSCFGKSDGKVTLNITGGTQPYSYSSGPNITQLAAGNYDYTITDTNGCNISASFTIAEPTQIVLNVSPSVTVQCGEQIPLIAEAFNGTGEFSYLWTGPGVQCANCSNAYAIASESAAYDVVATDENGCFNVAQVISEVNCNVYIPNAFTPSNGDMVNPLFLVYTGSVQEFSFSVYDRWGQLVFSSQNPDVGWNGFNGGKVAAQGVYVYKLNYRFPGGKEDTLLGHITLLGGN